MKVKISYGSGNVCEQEFPAGTTVGCVLSNQRVKQFLGYGASVEARAGGVPQANDTPLYSDISLSVTDKSCTKASI